MPPLDWLWSYSLGSAVRGLTLAREAELLLARLDDHSLALLNSRGDLQARSRLDDLADACISDDGSAIVAAGAAGQVWWLAPDLTRLREQGVPAPAVAVATDPFGRYLAVSDQMGHLYLRDPTGQSLAEVQSPRPIRHLAFVPMRAQLAAAADFGWAGCLDLGTAKWLWSDRPVSNIGSLRVAGNGDPMLLACFSDGLRRYVASDGSHRGVPTPAPCGLAAVTFTGDRIVAAGVAPQLFGFDSRGGHAFTRDLKQPPTALALSALGDRVFMGHADGTLVAARLDPV